MWTSFVSSVFDVNIACWDRAQNFWAGFSLKSKYGVGGMKSGGQRELVQDVHPGLILKVRVTPDRAN